MDIDYTCYLAKDSNKVKGKKRIFYLDKQNPYMVVDSQMAQSDRNRTGEVCPFMVNYIKAIWAIVF